MLACSQDAPAKKLGPARGPVASDAGTSGEGLGLVLEYAERMSLRPTIQFTPGQRGATVSPACVSELDSDCPASDSVTVTVGLTGSEVNH
jgi:hypothetical protein